MLSIGVSTDFFELFTQINVNNDNSLIPPVQWLTIANNALYTAIDFISQLILVSVFVTYTNLSLINKMKALPMLDHVAPTIGYGCPMHFIIGVLRCLTNQKFPNLTL